MDVLAWLAVVNCFISPFLFVALLALTVFFFRHYRQTGDRLKMMAGKIGIISRTAQNATRETWFGELGSMNYASELEVEAKFIYPMMRHLGYSAEDLRMRAPAVVRVGRQNVNGEADWIVTRDGKPVMVIEAKNQAQPLDTDVREQARSYCFAFGAPKYILTNGRELQVFQRGVESDMLVFDCKVDALYQKWNELYRLIGVHE